MAKEMEAGPTDFVLDMKGAAEASLQDVLAADAFLFCAPENLASLSGEMKEFFDRCYYGVFDTSAGTVGDSGSNGTSSRSYTETSRLVGLPVGVAIAAGSDGSNAARQVERICQGWRLRPVAETVIHRNGLPQTAAVILAPKSVDKEAQAKCVELGGLLAATVLL